MELILGLPPMSQYDAAATPMYNAFSTTPTLTPFTFLPAQVPLDLKNDWNAPGAAASLRMNFSEPDLAPDLELNQIVWEVGPRQAGRSCRRRGAPVSSGRSPSTTTIARASLRIPVVSAFRRKTAFERLTGGSGDQEESS